MTVMTRGAVSLVKANPVVRVVTIRLTSVVSSSVSVVERRDGSVWWAERRRPGFYKDGRPVSWMRVDTPFHVALKDRCDFERRLGVLRSVTVNNRMD